MKLKLACSIAFLLLALLSIKAQNKYQAPQSNRIIYNLNYDWKFIRQDVANAQNTTFNDASWTTVSLPHTYNDVDHYDSWIIGGSSNSWNGKTWYRKHFKLDASLAGRKVIVEFEGIRQAGEIYINGTWVGRHEDGITPCGIDISDYVNFGSTENVLAVKVDNNGLYKEVATGTSYVWNTAAFNPMYGGLVSNARLHVMDKLYQTLPLYSNMETLGTYVYAKNINFVSKTADITVESEITNTYDTAKTIDFKVVIVDAAGNEVATKTVTGNTFDASEKKTLTTTLPMSGIKFWSPDYPNLYKVCVQLSEGGNVFDVCEYPLGVRKVEFDAARGLSINGHFIWLKGFAPRSTMEWPNVGIAPNWMVEYDHLLMKAANGNFVRPMHVSPRCRDIESADRIGLIYACPAGDAEGDNVGRQWDQRVEVMRNSEIYYRNHPSIVFWEAGNQNITIEHMQEMKDVRLKYDPNGGRFSGTRSTSTTLLPVAEYGSSMDGTTASAVIPIWDAEYARGEAPRRVWDKYTPPSFGYSNIVFPSTTNTLVEYPANDFRFNSTEDLAMNNVRKYYDHWIRRGGQGLSSIMVGGAKIIFADGVSHGRMDRTEVARVSGNMDGARLPKESYYTMRVVQNDSADIHIVGHWNYPAGTKKTVYVVSNLDEVSLATYDESGALIKDYGKGVRNILFEFDFANVVWQPGKIVATGYKNGVAVKSTEIATVGAPAKLKLTPVLGPDGFFADGSDVAMFDVEVVDANGLRCPTVEQRVDFTYSGPGGNFLGGYNSGVEKSIYKDYLNVECGINRVFVRATRTAGDFTLNVTSAGLTPATATITSQPFDVTDGLTLQKPQVYAVEVGEPPLRPEFYFQNIIDAELNTEVISAPTIIMGIAEPKTIKIVAQSALTTATYSINGGPFTAAEGTVSEGDELRVKLTSDTQFQTARYVTINIDGVEEMFTVTTKKAPLPSTMPNLALNKPVIAFSSEQSSNGNYIANLNDGDIKTRWAGSNGNVPQSFTIDLLDAYNVARIEILPGASNRAFQFIVEGSLDGVSWFLLTNQKTNTVAGFLPVDFEPQAARYLKMTISGGTNPTTGKASNWATLYEFRAFEAPQDIPDQFHITPQTGLDLFSEAISEPFIVSGLGEGVQTEISLSENTEVAAFSINGGQFIFTDEQEDPIFVENGDEIRIQLGTGSQYSTTYSVKVTIGGIFDYFNVTTIDPPSDGIYLVNIGKELIIYPNPAAEFVNIRSSYTDNALVEIYSVSGTLVKKESLISGSGRLDLSDVNPGMYLVKYINKTQVLHGQLIKR
ncbi:MAG: discoidin domain-containing protein [Candidatus Azobacteroides sp.]|nr:discoidin domain-containing protein [Candidatus Azobacteroides sp.]